MQVPRSASPISPHHCISTAAFLPNSRPLNFHATSPSRQHPKPTMSSPAPSNDPPSPRDKRVRLINVYDAVAGTSPSPPPINPH